MQDKLLILVAVVSNWMARASAAIYTLLAFPLILDAVGTQKFSIFLYVTIFPAWLALAMLGAQGTAAYFLSRSQSRGASLLFRARFGTALVAPITLLTLCTLVASALILTGVIGTSISEAQFVGETRRAILVSLWLTALVVLGGVFENFSLAIGKLYVFNFVRISAVTLSLIGLLIAVRVTTYVPYYVMIQIVPQVVLLYIFGLKMVNEQKAFPIFDTRFLRHISSRINAGATSGFFLMSLPFIINVQLGVAIVGLVYGAADVALLLVLLRILVFAAAFFGAITGAAWPLLGRYYARGESELFRRNALQLVMLCTGIAIVAFLAFFTLGPWAIDLWLPTLSKNTLTIQVFAVYLSMYLWNTLWLAVLTAAGQVFRAGLVSVAEATIGLFLSVWLFSQYQSFGYIIGLIIGTALSTSIIAPILGFQAITSGVASRRTAASEAK